MALQQQMMNSVVRILGEYYAGTELAERGVIGTGFILTVDSEQHPGQKHGYLVTCAHVLDRQIDVEIQTFDSETGVVHSPQPLPKWWVPMPGVDVAVAPLDEPQGDRNVIGVSSERHLIPTKLIQGVRLGGKVYNIGILAPLDRVMVRSGTVGAVDQVGIKHAEGYNYPAHLIDCRSYWGFSGSPCWIEIPVPLLTPVPIYDPDGEPVTTSGPTGQMGYWLYMVGMLTEHLAESAKGGATSLYGVATVLRGQEIRAALMADEVVEH
jgi:hypothetical protein